MSLKLKPIIDPLNAQGHENLQENMDKIEQAYSTTVERSIEAANRSKNAETVAEQAKQQALSTQTQLNQIVVEGDSSVEAAQARVSADDTVYDTLKERLDTEHTQVTQQLTQTILASELAHQIRAQKLERQRFMNQSLRQGTATITNTSHDGYFKTAESFITIAIGGIPQDNTNYDVNINLVSGDSGLVGDLIVYDKTLNGFKVKMTGSAPAASFTWTLINKEAA